MTTVLSHLSGNSRKWEFAPQILAIDTAHLSGDSHISGSRKVGGVEKFTLVVIICYLSVILIQKSIVLKSNFNKNHQHLVRNTKYSLN